MPSPSIVLVVEDMSLVAMELESVLTDAGYVVLGPVASVVGGLALLANSRPDAAVLDVNLGSEKVTPIALALKRENIPFVLASATRPIDLTDLPVVLSGALNIGKPTDSKALLAAVRNMLSE